MAQSGYTPVQLYRSTTAGATPSAGNLQDGELAINTRDGKIYYKNYAGAVTQFKSLPIDTVAAITTSTTLTSASAGYQQTQMTAIGQSVTLPDATTLSVGAPLYVIDNTKGFYPVGIRDNSGALLMAVAAGGEAYVALEDKSTAAGVWSVTGTNLEPGLITIDSTLSSTYRPVYYNSGNVLGAGTYYLSIPSVTLDSNTTIHFAFIGAASGFAAYILDNTGKVVTTPVTVSTYLTAAPKAAFKISSTQAIVFYGADSSSPSSATDSAVVLTVSGTSPSLTLSVGTPASVGAGWSTASWGGESYEYPAKITQLTTNLYLACGQTTTASYAMAISVSGATVTIGSPLTISSFGGSPGTFYCSIYPVTSTTGCFVGYDSNASQISAVVISVSGTTCTAGTLQSTSLTSPSFGFASAQMSSTKIMIFAPFNTSNFGVQSFTISGTSITMGTALTVETIVTQTLSNSSIFRLNPSCWAIDSTKCFLSYFEIASLGNASSTSGMSRAVVITESSGTLTAGTITYGSISPYATTTGSGATGYIGPNGLTDFISVDTRTTTITTPNVLITKISGTNVLPGEVTTLNTPFSPGTGGVSGRLSNGDYIICGSSAFSTLTSNITPFISVLRPNSNKDRITLRGTIRVPSVDWQQLNNVVVSTNRIVVVSTTFDTGQQSSTIRQRILSIEIAA